MGDFALKRAQTYPKFDLTRVRQNAEQLAAVYGLFGHFAALEVRKTRSEEATSRYRLPCGRPVSGSSSYFGARLVELIDP